MVLPILRRIEIFPVKSLDDVVLQNVTVLPSGVIKGDSSTPRVRHSQQRFIQFPETPQPSGLSRERFKHFYKLAVNTNLAPDSQAFQMKIGNEIKILLEKNMQYF
jgi:uncharacterized protein YcbX